LSFVTYNGAGSGYLLILTNKKRSERPILPPTDEMPVGLLYILKGQIVAVSEQDLQILMNWNHIGKGKLEEVPPPPPPDKLVVQSLK
jgi:hypothetical protein